MSFPTLSSWLTIIHPQYIVGEMPQIQSEISPPQCGVKGSRHRGVGDYVVGGREAEVKLNKNNKNTQS